MALFVPAVFGGAAWLAAAVLRELGPMAYVVGGAVLLSTTFAVRGLGQAGQTTRRAVEKGDRLAARASLRKSGKPRRERPDRAPHPDGCRRVRRREHDGHGAVVSGQPGLFLRSGGAWRQIARPRPLGVDN